MSWGNPVIFTDCGEIPMITTPLPRRLQYLKKPASNRIKQLGSKKLSLESTYLHFKGLSNAHQANQTHFAHLFHSFYLSGTIAQWFHLLLSSPHSRQNVWNVSVHLKNVKLRPTLYENVCMKVGISEWQENPCRLLSSPWFFVRIEIL